MLGTRNLAEILSDRDNLANAMQVLLILPVLYSQLWVKSHSKGPALACDIKENGPKMAEFNHVYM